MYILIQFATRLRSPDTLHFKSELYSAFWGVTPCSLVRKHQRLGDPTTLISVDGLVINMATKAVNTNCVL